MKGKKINRLVFIIIIIILGLSAFLYQIFNPTSTNDTVRLSLFEKRWIETNKNKLIDIAILNDLPLFGKDGKGIFFSFMQDFESDTGLEFNKISYSLNGDIPEVDYRFRVVNNNYKLKDNDLLFYEDNYVILSKANKKIINTNSMSNANIGVLSADLSAVSTYINNSNNISYTPVDTVGSLISSFDSGRFDYIVVPKSMYLDSILQKSYYVNYYLNGLVKKYVLTLPNNNSKLNSIIRKNYNVWINKYFVNNYNSEMFNLYCLIKNIDDKSKVSFEGKRYVYGYIDNLPYETTKNNKFIGINSEFVNGFANFSSVEFTYKKYNNVYNLNQAMKDGKVDIAFNYYQYNGLGDKLYHTVSPINSDYVIISNIYHSNVAVDSIKGLYNQKIAVIKDTQLASYISKNTNATIKVYNNINSMLSDKDSLLMVDYITYDYYKTSKFRNYVVVYQDRMTNNYNYIINNDNSNTLFYNLFQFYLSNISLDQYRNIGISETILNSRKIDLSFLWLYIILIPVLLIVVMTIIGKRKQIRRIKTDDKLKYIDPLTSLKNRYYLTQNMKKWEENTIYPQAILLIDLNNLKDVNDNYGHEEGDRLIKTSANILINNQLENTDIVRTDGNEFTIYMVGYDENQVVSYMRKLYRLLKELPYEYGASLGYSMILDDIKTIDDAINEAILDMVTNKENQKDSDL